MRGMYSSSRKSGSAPEIGKKSVRKESPAPSNQEGASAPKPSPIHAVRITRWHRDNGGSHDWPTYPEWLKLLDRRADNGLDSFGVVFKIGRRNMIDVDRFHAWLRAQQDGGAR